MRKIPTLYQRTEDRRHVTDVVTPGCEWVLAGDGIPTRKLDGVCMMLDVRGWWARREVKPDKPIPHGFVEREFDPVTGKRVGWEPIEQSPFVNFWREAVSAIPESWDNGFTPGTYELCGPKINGNPENFPHHRLVPHDVDLLRFEPGTPAALIEVCRVHGWEGVVWHHPDGQMAKLKVRDYPRSTT
jgi:hypothetical protein